MDSINSIVNNLSAIFENSIIIGFFTILSILSLMLGVIIIYMVKNHMYKKDYIPIIVDKLNELERARDNHHNYEADNMHHMLENNIVDVCLKLNTTLKRECSVIAKEVNADRIAVYLFHNGVTGITGIPFLRTSCICEYIRRGSSIFTTVDHSNIPISFVSDIVERLIRNKEFIVNRKNINYLDKLIMYLILHGAGSVGVFIGIYDSEDQDNIIGFLCVEFIEDKYDVNNQETILEKLRVLADRSSAVLQISSLGQIYNNQ